MEIFSIQAVPTDIIWAQVLPAEGDINWTVGTKDNPGNSDPTTFFNQGIFQNNTATITGTVSTKRKAYFQNYSDGAGHGILVATDSLFFRVKSTNVRSNIADFRVYYRFKEVALAEYIGIVQSQQGG